MQTTSKIQFQKLTTLSNCSCLSQDWVVKKVLNSGVPRNKIVFGIPTYGRCFSTKLGLNPPLGSPAYKGLPGPATHRRGLLAYYEVNCFFPITLSTSSSNLSSPVVFKLLIQCAWWDIQLLDIYAFEDSFLNTSFYCRSVIVETVIAFLSCRL